jgi:hypothetical protein
MEVLSGIFSGVRWFFIGGIPAIFGTIAIWKFIEVLFKIETAETAKAVREKRTGCIGALWSDAGCLGKGAVFGGLVVFFAYATEKSCKNVRGIWREALTPAVEKSRIHAMVYSSFSPGAYGEVTSEVPFKVVLPNGISVEINSDHKTGRWSNNVDEGPIYVTAWAFDYNGSRVDLEIRGFFWKDSEGNLPDALQDWRWFRMFVH